MKQIELISKAISTIISHETLPPQIDYVSPGKKAEVRKANDFLKTLLKADRDKAYAAINEQVEDYYSPIDGMDGQSLASLDAMF